MLYNDGRGAELRSVKVINYPLRMFTPYAVEPAENRGQLDADVQEEQSTTPIHCEGIGDLSGKTWTPGTRTFDIYREMGVYQNFADDSDPLDPTAPQKGSRKPPQDTERILYSSVCRLKKTLMLGERLWTDLISAFRLHTVRSWTMQMITEWRELLIRRIIYVKPGRTR